MVCSLLCERIHPEKKEQWKATRKGILKPDGLSLEAATPVTDFLILRGGYGNLYGYGQLRLGRKPVGT